MTIDPQIWNLAQARCKASGFENTQDIQTMAEAIQETVEGLEAEWEERYESEM